MEISFTTQFRRRSHLLCLPLLFPPKKSTSKDMPPCLKERGKKKRQLAKKSIGVFSSAASISKRKRKPPRKGYNSHPNIRKSKCITNVWNSPTTTRHHQPLATRRQQQQQQQQQLSVPPIPSHPSCPLAPSHTAKRATIGGRGGGGGREGMAPRQIRSNTPPSLIFFRGTPAGECVHFPSLSLSRKKKNYNIRVKIMRFHPSSFFLLLPMAAKKMFLMAHRIA